MSDQTSHGSLDLPGLGRIWIEWSEIGLVRVQQFEPIVRADRAVAVPARFADPLFAYAQGENVDPSDIEIELRGTSFQTRVWTALREVRRGQVCTYGDLARAAGSPGAMRAVGTAMSKNPLPIVVPCHRVIAQGARIGGYTGGLPRKCVLLAIEGVRVTGDRIAQSC